MPPSRLVLTRELGDVQHVGQRLLAAGPEHESDVGPRRFEDPRDGVRDGPMIAVPVQLLQQPQGVGDWHEVRRRLGGQRQLGAGIAAQLVRDAERMEQAESMPVLEQVLVVDGEQRPLQRREHRQLVVGPLDGRQSRANRLDFLAVVERLAADEQMRNARALPERSM